MVISKHNLLTYTRYTRKSNTGQHFFPDRILQIHKWLHKIFGLRATYTEMRDLTGEPICKIFASILFEDFW